MNILMNNAATLRKMQDDSVLSKMETESNIVGKLIQEHIINSKSSKRYVSVPTSKLSKETIKYLKERYNYIIGERPCGPNEYEYIVSWFENDWELQQEYSGIQII